MNYQEKIRPEVTKKQPETFPKEGIPLNDLVTRKDIEMDETMASVLRLMLEQNKYLAQVEVLFIPPEEEPNTGGCFHLVKVNKDTIVPSIFIVVKQKEHLEKLFGIRRSSVELVAQMLGIEARDLTSDLLRQFIIAHEFGHTTDYIKNYESNSDYLGTEAAEAWRLHYDSNLLSLPVKGLDPAELQEEISQFSDLPAFLKAYPEVSKNIDQEKIKTLDDLLGAQEIAYRSSAYESYADDFATNFLKKNAQALEITELLNKEK